MEKHTPHNSCSEPGHLHHSHHHHHSHGTLDRLGLAFALNLSFALIELAGGYWTNSMAILTDALHDFGDAIALALAIVLEKLSRQAANEKHSYGYRRFSAAAALITGFILVGGSMALLTEAIPRLFHPQIPHAPGMIALAVLGVAVNGFAAWKVSHGATLNERMMTWHLLEDVLGWAAVLVGGILIYFTGWIQIDPILACLLSVWILYNVMRNLREVLGIFLQMVPRRLSIEAIEKKMRKIPGVKDIHHVHLWSLDGERHILTAHVVTENFSGTESDLLRAKLKTLLRTEGVAEATLEFESFNSECFDPDHK